MLATNAATSRRLAFDRTHDAYGNRVWDHATPYAGTASLVYDDANRFVEVKDPANGFATLATYTYDAFGRRWALSLSWWIRCPLWLVHGIRVAGPGRSRSRRCLDGPGDRERPWIQAR